MRPPCLRRSACGRVRRQLHGERNVAPSRLAVVRLWRCGCRHACCKVAGAPALGMESRLLR
jgi:hypothetical protein